MIAFDTNLLVYAHREENPWHAGAKKVLLEIAQSRDAWAIPWSCVHEFIGIVTNPRIFQKPTDMALALQFFNDLKRSSGLTMLAEDEGYLEILAMLCQKGKIQGALIHDARIAAVCLLHGVRTLYSADRDFGRFPALKVVNPLIDATAS